MIKNKFLIWIRVGLIARSKLFYYLSFSFSSIIDYNLLQYKI